MSNIKISDLPAGVANLDAVVPADNSAGNLTEKITLGDIAALINPPVTLTFNTTLSTDASLGGLFDVTLTDNTTLDNPTNGVDGQTIRWRILQDSSGGRTVTLGGKFNIPSSAVSPLPWSTSPNKMDILAATYHSVRDKWDVIAFVPGY